MVSSSTKLSTIAVLSLAANALAQEPTPAQEAAPLVTSVFMGNLIEELPVTGFGASVVTVHTDRQETILVLNCPPDQQTACQSASGAFPSLTVGYNPSQVLVQGSVLLSLTPGAPAISAVEGTSCALVDNAPVTCSVTGSQEGAFTGSTDEVLTFQQPLQYVPVTITAGQEKLPSATAGNTGAAPTGATPTDAAGSAAAQPTTGAADRLVNTGLMGVAGALAAIAFAL